MTKGLNEDLVPLKELFGVMQQVARDARSRFDNSLTNVQYPNRGIFLEDLDKKLASGSKLPTNKEIEKLWFELQREMTESGKVVKFFTDVIDNKGSKISTEVIRVGLFNIVSDGKYLNYNSGTLNELIKSPNEKYTVTTSNLFRANNDKVLFGLDITTGQVISCFSVKEEKNTDFCKKIFIKNMENCDLLCQMANGYNQ